MPLSLGQIAVKAIVDWHVEWKDGKEFPRNPIRRGMIVRVDGDPHNEQVEGIWVTFGEGIGKDKFEFNKVSLNCIKVQARELNLLWDSADRRAREAWNRTFRVAEDVGQTFESRTVKASKPRISDSLQLTGAPAKGPIQDAPPAPALKTAEADEE